MNHMKLRSLCEGAVLVAVAQILSYLKLWEMPWGGSVVLSMIPLVLYAVRWGLGAGLLGGFAFGVLQFMFDGGFAIGWQSILDEHEQLLGALERHDPEEAAYLVEHHLHVMLDEKEEVLSAFPDYFKNAEDQTA